MITGVASVAAEHDDEHREKGDKYADTTYDTPNDHSLPSRTLGIIRMSRRDIGRRNNGVSRCETNGRIEHVNSG